MRKKDESASTRVVGFAATNNSVCMKNSTMYKVNQTSGIHSFALAAYAA